MFITSAISKQGFVLLSLSNVQTFLKYLSSDILQETSGNKVKYVLIIFFVSKK